MCTKYLDVHLETPEEIATLEQGSPAGHALLDALRYPPASRDLLHHQQAPSNKQKTESALRSSKNEKGADTSPEIEDGVT